MTGRQVSSLRVELEALGSDYLPLDKPGGEVVRLRFIGPFEGREVVWEARFITLAAWQRAHPQSEPRNFIEVTPGEAGHMALEVGLPLSRFGDREITMTIRMIRQYKRLRRGRHVYGERYRG